jgi:hypothetical protein
VPASSPVGVSNQWEMFQQACPLRAFEREMDKLEFGPTYTVRDLDSDHLSPDPIAELSSSGSFRPFFRFFSSLC